MLALAVVAGASAKTKAVKTQQQLKFDPTIGETRILTMPDGWVSEAHAAQTDARYAQVRIS